MGANIGTTATSWILSLTGIEGDNLFVNLLKPSSFSPVLAIIGVVCIMFVKKQKVQDIGKILVFCHFNDRYGCHEQCSRAVGRCTAVYTDSDDVFQSGTWYACWS